MKALKTVIMALSMVSLSLTSVFAGGVVIPHTFTKGTPAVAAQVNANFNALKYVVDGNSNWIAANEIDINANAADIAALALSVSDYATRVASLEATVASLQSTVNDLSAKLAHLSVDNSTTLNGLAPPHVIFTGANVHIQNGAAQTDTNNGLGNLIIGYNEDTFGTKADWRYGSHNLVVGPEHWYQSYGGLVAGYDNDLRAAYASATGGRNNYANAPYGSVSGGYGNVASGSHASVSGGYVNEASGDYSSISGGRSNDATNTYASVSGGYQNVASGAYASVSGGYSNEAGTGYASVTGGYGNLASGNYASVSGGYANTASGSYSSVSGGAENSASGESASVSGGASNQSSGWRASIPGGYSKAGNASYAYDPPDYDSGWVTRPAGTEPVTATLNHNLGGAVDDYVIRIDTTSTAGITNINTGRVRWYFEASGTGTLIQVNDGVYYSNVTTSAIDVTWLEYSNVRIRMWRKM